MLDLKTKKTDKTDVNSFSAKKLVSPQTGAVCHTRKDWRTSNTEAVHKTAHLFLILALLLPLQVLAANSDARVTPSPSQAASTSFDRLLDAIEQVESSGREKVIGDGGNAHGAYQLHKIYVDDVNRILGRKVYTYADRMNRQKSRQMVTIYLNHYGKGLSLIDKARIHNGGSTGHKK